MAFDLTKLKNELEKKFLQAGQGVEKGLSDLGLAIKSGQLRGGSTLGKAGQGIVDFSKNVINAPVLGDIGYKFPKTYAENQIANPLLEGVKGLQQKDPVKSLSLLQAAFNSTPGALPLNTTMGTLAGLARGARTGEDLKSSVWKGITEPSSLGSQGLDLPIPLALGVDLLATRNPKSTINSLKNLPNAARSFAKIKPKAVLETLAQEAKNIKNVKERGLITSVKEAPNITASTKIKTAGEYIQKSNKQLMGEAKALLSEGASIDFKNAKNLDQKVAATIQEAISLDKVGNHEAAANLFNNLSEHGTEMGRGVQAFSLLNRMSPEAIALSAAGKIKQFNRTHTTKIPELTGDQQKTISDAVSKMEGLTNGSREKNIALNELENLVNSFIPSSKTDKLLAVWKAGLLTSLRTQERNLLGNALNMTAEVAKDPIATLADKAMSLKTGLRTQTTTLRGLEEFGSKPTRQQMIDIFSKGYDPSVQIDKFDYRAINWGKSLIEQTAKKYTDFVFRTLGASDKPFYNAAFARSLYDQAGAAAMNEGKKGSRDFVEQLVKNPTPEMLKTAVNEASIATFKNRNIASNVASALKREMSKNEYTHIFGEITMPFTGVPSSILGQTIAYSPIGLVKGLSNAGKVVSGKVPELQRQAAQEIGRGVIGTGILGLGAYLAEKGLITGQPKDTIEARQWELENKPRNSILVDGKWRSLNSIGPETIVILAGAKFNEEMNKPERSLGTYGFGLLKDQIDQSFVTGLQQPVNALTDPARYGKSYLGNQMASVIPNILKDAVKSQDSYAREANTSWDYFVNSTPWRNQQLVKRDVLGRPIAQEPTGAAAFVDVFNSKTPVRDAVTDELSRLNGVGENATPSKLNASQTIAKQKIKLTPEKLDQLEAGSGEQVREQLNLLIASPEYQALTDEEKAKAIDKVVTKVRTQFKNENAIDFGLEALPQKETKTTTKKEKKVAAVKKSTPKAAKTIKIAFTKAASPRTTSFKIKAKAPKMQKVKILKIKSKNRRYTIK